MYFLQIIFSCRFGDIVSIYSSGAVCVEEQFIIDYGAHVNCNEEHTLSGKVRLTDVFKKHLWTTMDVYGTDE